LDDSYRKSRADDNRAFKRVAILSNAGWPNFGDRLGFHLLNKILPPDSTIVHCFWPRLDPCSTDIDLLILLLGTSLFHRLLNRELLDFVAKFPAAIGIFGTQYRKQLNMGLMNELLHGLTFWYARYQEDLDLFGRPRNATHLGDWLVDCFPLTRPEINETLTIEADLIRQEIALDRLIQHISRYRFVRSARLHPLLCALTSADEVAYIEQREFGNNEVSGKFRSLLLDVFHHEYGEGEWIPVDRDAVVMYKRQVSRNIDDLRNRIYGLLYPVR
jgi:hypothetical protein